MIFAAEGAEFAAGTSPFEPSDGLSGGFVSQHADSVHELFLAVWKAITQDELY